MWRKVALRSLIGTLGTILLVLLFMHTSVAERMIFNNLKEIAADYGIRLDAKRMDLYPFMLKVDFEGLSVQADYLDAQIEQASFNANSGVLIGKIDLDRIALEGANILFEPDKLPPSEPSNEPLQLPAVNLNQAAFKDVQLQVGDQKSDISLTLDDIGFEYLNNQLNARLKLQPMQFAQRQFPAISAQLQAETASFQQFDNLQATLSTAQSQIKVTGNVDGQLKPNLSYSAHIEPDLVAELPGPVDLKGTFDGDRVTLDANHQLRLLEHSFPLNLQTETRLSQSPMILPLQLNAEGLAQASGEVRYSPEQLSGQLSLNGDPAGIHKLVPQLNLDQLKLNGNFTLPDLDPAKLSGDLALTSQGWPATELKAQFIDGQMQATGQIKLDPATPPTQVQARYDGTLSLAAQGQLSNLDLVNIFAPLPPELCTETVSFNLALQQNGENLTLQPSSLVIEDVNFNPISSGPLLLFFQGPLQDLQGKLWAPALYNNGDAVDFALDLSDEPEWRHLQVQLNNLPLPELPYEATLDVGFSAEGPLLQPQAIGLVQGQLRNADGIVADLEAPLELTREQVQLRDLRFATAAISGSADFTAQLAEPLTWQLDALAQNNIDPELVSIIPVELPQFNLRLQGDQRALNGALTLPEQSYEIEQMALPMNGEPLALEIDPQGAAANASLPYLNIAGLRLAKTEFQGDGKSFIVKTKLDLVDPVLFEQVFGSFIPEYIELNDAKADLCFESTWDFADPRFAMDVQHFDALVYNEPLQIEELHAYLGPSLYVAPFQLDFAGLALNAEVGEVPKRFRELAEGDFDELAIKAQLKLKDAAELQQFAGANWPEGLDLNALNSEVSLYYDTASGPQLLFNLKEIDAFYNNQLIQVKDLRGSYVNQNLNLQPATVRIGNSELKIVNKPDGFRIVAEPDTAFLAAWGAPFVGETSFHVWLDWQNLGSGDFLLKGLVRQQAGKLIYPDPLLEMSNLVLPFRFEGTERLVFEGGNAKLNDGSIELDGEVDMQGAEPNVRLGLYADNVDIASAAYQVRLTSAVEYVKDAETNQLTSTVQIQEGYFHPDFKVETLVQELLAGDEELYFPDPFLEAIDLQAMVIAKAPLIVSTNIGFFELETPGLLIQGNLAEPVPSQGMILINEGSLLESGQKTLFFQDSYVRFEASRPNDPYLQITIVEPTFGNEDNLLTIFGYMSELGQSVSGSNVNAFLINYVLGRVSSLVTLEVEFDDTLVNSDFTTVVSRAITPRIELRYILPADEQQAERTLQLRIGPFYRNYLSLEDRGGSGYVGLLHRQKLGYLNDDRSPIINKVNFEPRDIPRRLRLQFGFLHGAPFTETTWRRGEWEAIGYLRRRGYLSAKLDHSFEDGVLTVNIETGEQVTINVDGITFDNDDRERLFRQLRRKDLDPRVLSLLIENVARSKGHPSAAAFVNIEGNHIEVSVVKGTTVDDVGLEFGDANPMLEGRFSKKETRALINQLLVDPRAQREKIRAKLAARGYLDPTFDEPYFKDDFTFVLPIDPGRRGILKNTYVNEQAFNFTGNGKPFTFSMLSEVVTQVLNTKRGSPSITIEPERADGDIVFQVTVTERPDPEVKELVIEGTGRVKPDRVRDYLGFEPGMRQSTLVERQKELLRTGAYQVARMQVNDGIATLEVEERNRWDINYEGSWGEREKFGYGIQLTDRFLGHRLYSGTLRLNRSSKEDTVLGAINFPRFRGSIFDVRVGTDWVKERQENGPQEIITIGGDVDEQFTKSFTRTYNIGFSYPIFERQRLTHTFERTKRALRIRTISTEFDLDTFEEVEVENISESETTTNTLRNSWTYDALDNPLSPKNGLFTQATIEWFPEAFGTSPSVAGSRYIGKASYYWTSGRWYWGQRLEGGYYKLNIKPESRNLAEDSEESRFFTLGGPNSIRGFRTDYVGPLFMRNVDFEGEDGVTTDIAPFGGQAFMLMTQEVNYDFYWQGLGLSPFIDAGWVWDDPAEFLSTDLVVTGGVGLTWRSPIGFLRLDHAWSIDRSVLDRELTQLYEEQVGPDANVDFDQVNQRWSIRFGRVF